MYQPLSIIPAALEHMRPRRGDTIVVKMTESSEAALAVCQEAVKVWQEYYAALGVGELFFLLVPPGMDVAALSEKDMAAAGWVRKKAGAPGNPFHHKGELV